MEAADRPSRVYAFLLRMLRTLVRVFFREVEVTGLESVPRDRGGLIVSWHPNGLVDPGLILTQFPDRVVFGARHGLFSWPILGFVLRAIGTVPIYRATDARDGSGDAARREANRKSLDALAGEIAKGSYSALFPEGTSHDAPHLLELKTGAARLYYRARELTKDGKPPVILPVGLHYDQKALFRSRALVWFHPPLELPPDLDVTPAPGESAEAEKARVAKLTQEIERALRDVVHATEDWDIHQLLHRARKLVRAERAKRAGATPNKPGIGETAVAFQRVRTGYYARLRTHPEEIAALRERVRVYDEDLRALGVEDHELDRDPRLASKWLPALLIMQALFVYLLMPPVLIVGWLVNGPTALALIGLTRVGARLEKDEATIKLLVGALLFPATWVFAGTLAALAHARLHAAFPSIPHRPILAGVTIAVLSAIGGAVALRGLHVAAETARSVRVRLTRLRRRRSIERLLAERAALADAVLAMGEGLALVGEVRADGTVRL